MTLNTVEYSLDYCSPLWVKSAFLPLGFIDTDTISQRTPAWS